jgi:hypothetical protein
MRIVTFHEEQQFRQLWVWLLIVPLTFGTAIVFGYGMVTQLIFGTPWTGDPLPDAALLILGALVILVMVGINFMLILARMVTEVSEAGITVRFRPFVNRHIGWDEITGMAARKYSPIGEYGGWGVRWSPGKGMAYNVRGNMGVELTLATGRKLMLGSQRHIELAAAIDECMTRHGVD